MQKLKPHISIIVPNYNHTAFLNPRLESIFNQSYQDFEVILLDDASIDDSVSILKAYKKHPKVSSLIVNEVNSKSTFKQWQKGIELAKGDYIWIAESDDFCELTFLEKMTHFFNQHPSVGLVFCQTIDVDKNGKPFLHREAYTAQFQPNIWEKDFVINGREFVTEYLNIMNVIPNASAVMFKRKCTDDHFFSKSLLKMKMCGDWFFWMQLALNTNVGFLHESLNYFRNHENVSRNHSNLAIIKRRLIEEKEIRNYAQQMSINNSKQEKLFYVKWFRYFHKKSIFSKEFYKAKLKETSKLKYLFLFIGFKLSKRKLW